MVFTPAELKEIRAYLDDIPFKYAAPLVNLFAKKEMEEAVAAAEKRSRDLADEQRKKRDEDAKTATPPPAAIN